LPTRCSEAPAETAFDDAQPAVRLHLLRAHPAHLAADVLQNLDRQVRISHGPLLSG
jgi:hypothetical protein